MRVTFRTFVPSLAIGLCLFVPGKGIAYVTNGHWSSTATDSATGPSGTPITLTWSIVPDGTTISHLAKPSNLVSFLDGLFGSGPDGSDYELRPWFPLIESSFARWTALSGITFLYEPADDGLPSHAQGQWPGLLNVRGDVRLGGALRDGAGGVYAESGLIPNADITFDTADSIYFGAPGTDNSYINLRNTLMHEIGHSMGFGHTVSPSAAFLMESAPNSTFEGPQFDDIRGAHYLYGDAFEKGQGNNSPENATDLGSVVPEVPLARGLDATGGVKVDFDNVDFLSITNSSDVDFFSFQTTSRTRLDLVVAPAGPSFSEFIFPGPTMTVDASMMSDLSLQLYGGQPGDLELLAESNLGGVGVTEAILNFELPTAGNYFARITGSADAVQFYTLSISVEAIAAQQAGDFNEDGEVDAADYTVWRDHLGESDDASIHDRGDGLPGISGDDYQVWKDHFGAHYHAGGASGLPVPEPDSLLGAWFACGALFAIARPGKHRDAMRRIWVREKSIDS